MREKLQKKQNPLQILHSPTRSTLSILQAYFNHNIMILRRSKPRLCSQWRKTAKIFRYLRFPGFLHIVNTNPHWLTHIQSFDQNFSKKMPNNRRPSQECLLDPMGIIQI